MLLVAECVLRIVQPFCIGAVVNFFSKSSSTVTYSTAGWCTFGICATTILIGFIRVHYIGMQQTVGMNIGAALSILVFQKVLKLSNSSLEQVSVGKILNLLSNDFNRFEEFAQFFYYVVCAPVQIVIVIIILSRESDENRLILCKILL